MAIISSTSITSASLLAPKIFFMPVTATTVKTASGAVVTSYKAASYKAPDPIQLIKAAVNFAAAAPNKATFFNQPLPVHAVVAPKPVVHAPVVVPAKTVGAVVTSLHNAAATPAQHIAASIPAPAKFVGSIITPPIPVKAIVSSHPFLTPAYKPVVVLNHH